MSEIDLNQVDVEELNRLKSQMISQLSDINPNLNFQQGVLRDIIVHWHALFSAETETRIQKYLDSRSLSRVIQNPDLFSEEVVDDILSNWNVQRKLGVAAKGLVVVEISSPSTISIPVNLRFTTESSSYSPDFNYVARLGVSNDNRDRAITPVAENRWMFTIPVTAVTEGSSGTIARDTALTPSQPIVNFLRSYAGNDFAPGRSRQKNSELVAQLLPGVAKPGFSNRVQLSAWLQENFPGLATNQNSVVGAGDIEMLRDRHSLFPISTGSKIDWYIRTSPQTETQFIPVSANLVGNRWVATLGVEQSDGVYEVLRAFTSLTPNPESSLPVVEESRQLEFDPSQFMPEIHNNLEGLYTAFDTITISFPRTEEDLDGVVEKSCSVEVKKLGSIREIQQLVSSPENRTYGADILVRLPIPVFTTVAMSVEPSLTPARETQIKNAVSDYINQLGFSSKIYVSPLLDVIHGYLETNEKVTSIQVMGSLTVDGESLYYVSDPLLFEIPERPQSLVTKNTLQFFCPSSNVII